MPSINGIVSFFIVRSLRNIFESKALFATSPVIRWKPTCRYLDLSATGVAA